MRAAVIDRFGSPGELYLASISDPALGRGQVRIRVIAAGVGATDAITRAGGLISAERARFPMVLGWDAAGVVEELAPDVDAFCVGDPVVAFSAQAITQAGTYAEQLVVDADAVAPAPAGIELEAAATLPLSALTAAQALQAACFGAGQRLLIVGATGAVGRFACQLAARQGMVIAAVSSRNAGQARLLGAEQVIARDEDLRGRLLHELGGLADAALNLAAPQANHLTQAAVRDGGHFATITGTLPPPQRGINATRVRVHADSRLLREMTQLMAAGVLTTTVGEVIALSDAARAHTLLGGRVVCGRIVLRT
jgi:NADPH:quinone reductase